MRPSRCFLLAAGTKFTTPQQPSIPPSSSFPLLSLPPTIRPKTRRDIALNITPRSSRHCFGPSNRVACHCYVLRVFFASRRLDPVHATPEEHARPVFTTHESQLLRVGALENHRLLHHHLREHCLSIIAAS